MKANVKQFGRGKKSPDIRTMAGKVEFTAENEVDAVQLGALYYAWFIKPDPALSEFRKRAINAYCEQNNVTLIVKEVKEPT